jgi:putative holliday junction resolvase
MMGGRLLAIDYGTRNVGLACADELRVTVTPLPSIPNRGARTLVTELARVVAEQDASGVVLGFPFNMDGTSGDAVSRVEKFAGRLRSELKVPVETVDERLSTVEASSRWRELTQRQQKRLRTIDSISAAIILERYIGEK